MLNLPPRKEYTLNQALEYLRKFHNEDRIDKEDLLYHAKEGNLKTVVFINGGRDLYNSVRGDYFTISRINRKELTELWLLDNDVKIIENNNLNVEKEIDLSTVYALVNEYLCTWFAIPKTKRMTKYPLQNILIGKNVDDDLRKLSPINEFEFGGYFRVDPSDYGQDLQEILDSNVIYKKGYNEFEITEHSNAYFSFMLSPENTYCELPISIDDILILHDDLMDFVGLDSRLTNDPKKEIEKLKKELEEKDKKIVELQTALEGKNFPIFLNQFMENDRLALAIQARKDYWANYDPNLNNAPKAESTAREIKEKYVLSKKQAEAIEIIACPINRN